MIVGISDAFCGLHNKLGIDPNAAIAYIGDPKNTKHSLEGFPGPSR